MEKIKLLLVEDDAPFAFILKGSLELTGLYDICIAEDAIQGLTSYLTFHPDVIVADIQMPGVSGLEMVKKIRQTDKRIPILFATGLTSPQDLLQGFEVEADSYIRKPFLPEELNAHIQAVLKRLVPSAAEKEYCLIGNYSFYVREQCLYWNDQKFALTDREAQILQKLYEARGELVERDAILKDLWGVSDFYTSRSLDVFVHQLRGYLRNDEGVNIQTVRGKGFRLLC